MEEKGRIAKEACRFITPGSTVLIDSGTTTLSMVPYLKEIPDLNLVTNDVCMAAELSNVSSSHVTVLGAVCGMATIRLSVTTRKIWCPACGWICVSSVSMP